MTPLEPGAGVGSVVEGPVTEAGQRLEDEMNVIVGAVLLGLPDDVANAKAVIRSLFAAARAEVIAEIRAGVERLGLIEPNDPDHPAWYFDGWHAALDAVLALLPPTEPK